MPGVLRDRFDDQVPDLTGQRVELLVRKTAQILRGVDALEQHGLKTLPLLQTRHGASSRPVTSAESASIAEYGKRAKNSSAWRANERIAT